MSDMWEALERYQPFADKHGFGAAWKRMTTERTKEAAWEATDAAGLTWWAGGEPEEAAWAAARGAPDAAIKHINRAIAEETK